MDNIQDEHVVLTDKELAEIYQDTWVQLKTHPGFAVEVLTGTGWIRRPAPPIRALGQDDC